jgi:hypothetical protein
MRTLWGIASCAVAVASYNCDKRYKSSVCFIAVWPVASSLFDSIRQDDVGGIGQTSYPKRVFRRHSKAQQPGCGGHPKGDQLTATVTWPACRMKERAHTQRTRDSRRGAFVTTVMLAVDRRFRQPDRGQCVGRVALQQNNDVACLDATSVPAPTAIPGSVCARASGASAFPRAGRCARSGASQSA